MTIKLINEILLFLGGIAVFLIGLKEISESAGEMGATKMKGFLARCSSSPLRGIATGTIVTAVAQSSIAINVVAVGFVESGVLSFYSASAIIMGANIGTTMTAQIISLSGIGAFDVTALGSLSAFIGFIVTITLKNADSRTIGGVLIGFGLIFIGLEIMGESVNFFKDFESFKNIFLVKSPLLLFLNGIVLTALMQSSSAVTGVMIILAGGGLLSFKSSIFLLLGANVGTCIPVIIASMGKGEGARQTALFNFFFNLFGAVVFFFPVLLFGEEISALFLKSGDAGRAIANFHTVFNLAVTAITLPLLKPFTSLIAKIVSGDDKKSKNLAKSRTFGYL